MKRWIHSATNASADLAKQYRDSSAENYLLRIPEFPEGFGLVYTLDELEYGDIIIAPSTGSGYVVLQVKQHNRAEDSANRGYNLIEQPSYGRVVAERNGNKVAVYKDFESAADSDEYSTSSENRDYSPSNPWDAPGMSKSDFI